jgi:hypothetical protein
MERNNNDMFDELVRGKLADYTEAPEPEWIRAIQAKKTRAVNLYQLYRLMLIAVIAGAGLFAGLQFLPYQHDVQTTVSQPVQQQQLQTAHDRAAVTARTTQTAEFASAGGDQSLNTSKTSSAHTILAGSGADKTETTTRQKQHTSAHPTISKQSSFESKTNTSTEKANISTPPQLNQETKPNTAVKTEEAKTTQPSDKKEEEHQQTTSVPCKATFDYYTDYSGVFNFVPLAPVSENASINWSFGDGADGDRKSVSHKYQRSGTYEVTLTITDGKNSCSVVKNIAYQNPDEKTTPITISGKVVAGAAPLKNAPVELFRFDEQKGRFKSDRTIRTNQIGEYTVTIDRNTRYLLRGYPTSEANNYTATYWGNTSETENATEIMVMPSESEQLLGYTIQLLFEEQPIEIANNKPVFPNTTDGTQQVFLVNGDNKVVSVGTVDANGNYNFGPGVDAGDYKIVNPGNGSSVPTSVTPDGKGLAGKSASLGTSGVASSSQPEKVTVYPNPASSIVNFGLNSEASEIATVVITDAGGVERSRQQIVITAGFNEAKYDISAFSPGIYYVMIYRNNKQVSSSRIVKLADTSK